MELEIKKQIIILLFLLLLLLLFRGYGQEEVVKETTVKEYKLPEPVIRMKVIEGYSSIKDKVMHTHRICPVTNMKTQLSGCIHSPPLNRGFIVSTFSKQEISTIQKSLKNADNVYTIKRNGSETVLYRNGEEAQVVLECNIENMKMNLKLAETEFM